MRCCASAVRSTTGHSSESSLTTWPPTRPRGRHPKQIGNAPLAALVPVERLEQMRRLARRQALQFMEQQQPIALTEAQASELAADAKRWARRSSRSRRKNK